MISAALNSIGLLSSVLFLNLLFSSITLARTTEQAHKLNGTTSYHDGPNCHSASLLGLGFIQQIRYVDSSELLYFLKSYCEQSDIVMPGTIHTWKFDDSIDHSALSTGNQTIFEKISIAGLDGHYQKQAQEDQDIYRIKNWNESLYNQKGSEQASPEHQVVNYFCDSGAAKDSHLKLSQSTSIFYLQSGFKNLEPYFLNRNLKLENFGNSLRDFKMGLNHVSSLIGDENHSLYTYALVASLRGALHNLKVELHNDFPEEWNMLTEEVTDHTSHLYEKIKLKNKSPIADAILKQSD